MASMPGRLPPSLPVTLAASTPAKAQRAASSLRGVRRSLPPQRKWARITPKKLWVLLQDAAQRAGQHPRRRCNTAHTAGRSATGPGRSTRPAAGPRGNRGGRRLTSRPHSQTSAAASMNRTPAKTRMEAVSPLPMGVQPVSQLDKGERRAPQTVAQHCQGHRGGGPGKQRVQPGGPAGGQIGSGQKADLLQKRSKHKDALGLPRERQNCKVAKAQKQVGGKAPGTPASFGGHQAAATQPTACFWQIVRQSFPVRTPLRAQPRRTPGAPRSGDRKLPPPARSRPAAAEKLSGCGCRP